MKRLLLVALTLVAALAVAPAAKADSYGYAYVGTAPPANDPSLTGDFWLTTSGNNATGGTFTIASTVGSFKAGTYNLSFGGFLSPIFGEFVFTGVGGTIDLLDVNGQWQIESNGQVSTIDDLTITPEPSSLILLGSGLLILSAFIFWKLRSSKPAAAKEPEPRVA